MTAFTEKLDRAAGAALCEGLTVAGQSLIGAGAVSLVAGGAGVVPIAFGAAALMASAAGCNWDSDGGSPAEPWPGDICYEGASDFKVVVAINGDPRGGETPLVRRITNTELDSTQSVPGKGSYQIWKIYWETSDGTTGNTNMNLGGPFSGITYTWIQQWAGDSTCNVPGPPPPEPVIPPYEFTDPEDGCSLTVYTEGWATDDLGALNPVFKIEPAAELRQGGGVIGGCNFSPVIYTGNPGGPGEPPIIRPWDPDWDFPDAPPNPWADFLRDVIAGSLGAGLADLLAAALETPYAGTTYRLVSVCETDSSGEPISQAVEEIIPSLPINDAILTRLDALVPLLQGQKDFKQPICPPAKASGDLRTISFRSEQVSPNGKSCLRKRLRYRSISGIGLDGLIDHWKDFSFQAGPVIVKHIGSTLGTLTVWAASVDEGKRVILHAFAEAGVDANQAGRWEVSGSSSSRRGMPGTMNVDTTGGYYWITARDGSSNRPIVGKT